MINTSYSNTSYVRQHTEISSFESEANRNPGATANEAMLERLAQNVPGLKKDDVTDLATSDFTPGKIAERISKFVEQGLQNARNAGRSEADIQSKFDAAVAGVKKGFEEAREILESLDLLNGDIASNVDKTEDLTFKALDAINPSGSSQPSIGTYHTQVAAAERFSSAETFSLDLKTQDGDTVKILFANQNSQEASFAAVSDGKGNSAASFELSQSHSSSFQFQVQGDLDPDELEAISKLITDVTEISNEFFNGDVQKAFESASEFTLDKTELASMNLQLTKSQEYSAASSYSSVQNNATPDIGKLSGHLLNNLDQITQRPELDFLQDISKVSQRLLDSLVQQDSRFIDADTEQQSVFNSSLTKIQDILETLRNARTDSQQPVDAILPASTPAANEES
ncbi:MAG: hypothetical protein ACI9ES_002753 [Oceanospirillaceae bacterium]|jgi:hypothetical protein